MFTRQKKILIIFLLIMLTGCIFKKKDDGKISLSFSFWGTPEEIRIIEDTLEPWIKDHPDVDLKLEHIPYSGYQSKLLTRMASKTAPDVIFTENNVFIYFNQKNALLDLTSYIKKDNEFDINDFFPEIVERFTRDGKIYVIPRDIAPICCVYYNKNLFDSAGVSYPTDNWNMNEFLEISKKLTKKNKSGNIIQYGFYTWNWWNFVYCFGGKFVDNVANPKKCILNTKEVINGLQFYKDLVYKYQVSPTPSVLAAGPIEMFKTGKIAMICSGIWETPVLVKIKKFKWEIAMFPKGPKGIRGFSTGGSGYGINKNTKYPELAWSLLKCLAGNDGQEMLAKTGLAQPANKRICNGKYWAKSKTVPLNKGMLNKAVKYIIFDPFHLNWNKAMVDYISPQIELILLNKRPVKDAIENIVKDVDKLLKE